MVTIREPKRISSMTAFFVTLMGIWAVAMTFIAASQQAAMKELKQDRDFWHEEFRRADIHASKITQSALRFRDIAGKQLYGNSWKDPSTLN